MSVVRHVVNGQELLVLPRNDSRDELLQLVIVLGSDEILSAFYSKHDLNVDLRVSVCHGRTIPGWMQLANGFLAGPLVLIHQREPYVQIEADGE